MRLKPAFQYGMQGSNTLVLALTASKLTISLKTFLNLHVSASPQLGHFNPVHLQNWYSFYLWFVLCSDRIQRQYTGYTVGCHLSRLFPALFKFRVHHSTTDCKTNSNDPKVLRLWSCPFMKSFIIEFKVLYRKSVWLKLPYLIMKCCAHVQSNSDRKDGSSSSVWRNTVFYCLQSKFKALKIVSFSEICFIIF